MAKRSRGIRTNEKPFRRLKGFRPGAFLRCIHWKTRWDIRASVLSRIYVPADEVYTGVLVR